VVPVSTGRSAKRYTVSLIAIKPVGGPREPAISRGSPHSLLSSTKSLSAWPTSERARGCRERGPCDARYKRLVGVTDKRSNLAGAATDDARMTWHVAFGFVLLVDRGRISGAWRYGLRGVVPVRVYVA